MTSTVVPLRRVFRVVNGGTPSSDPENWGGGIAWATPVDLASCNGGKVSSTHRTLTLDGLVSGSGAVPEASLLISTRAPIGYVAETTSTIAFNQGCKGLVPVQDCRYSVLSISTLDHGGTASIPRAGCDFLGTISERTCLMPDSSTGSISATRDRRLPRHRNRSHRCSHLQEALPYRTLRRTIASST